MSEISKPHISPQDWLDKTDRAKWSTAREGSRMGKSGYAPKKAQLADMVIEGREVVRGLVEQLEVYERLYAACLAFQSDDHESWKAVIHAMDAITAVSSPASEPLSERGRNPAVDPRDAIKPESGKPRSESDSNQDYKREESSLEEGGE